MSAPRAPFLHRPGNWGRGLALAMAAVVALTGCSSEKKREAVLTCPDVRIDADTAKLTRFRDGPGRDLTDIAYQIEVMGFTGDCGGKPGQTVDVKMQVMFQVTRGPAMSGPVGTFDYFAAIPAFYPSPDAKQILPVTFTFPKDSNINSMMVRDEEVTISIPVGGGVDVTRTPVYVGLQLTSGDLDYNRTAGR